jgi:uracil-DNA glycosylase
MDHIGFGQNFSLGCGMALESISEIKSEIKLEPGWKAVLKAEFEKKYMESLRIFLRKELRQGKRILPSGPEYFAAFNLTPFERVRVVILGQDPYHGPGQAHGLCFSVRSGLDLPPSLRNIFQELSEDIGCKIPRDGNLKPWADQGVLLLNATLTVEAGKAGSHQGKGWEEFTDRIIQIINEKKQGVVFVLWGSYAQKKAAFVDRKKHLVLESPHPSPLSSHRGFFGSKPFSKTNEFLKENPIDWH